MPIKLHHLPTVLLLFLLAQACVPEGALGHRITSDKQGLSSDAHVSAQPDAGFGDAPVASPDAKPTPDAMPAPDAAQPIDGGFDDSGAPIDGGFVDTGAPVDAGFVDTGIPGPVDTGVVGPVDTGVAGPVDTGVVGPVDTGVVGPVDTGVSGPGDTGVPAPADAGFPEDAAPIDTGFMDADPPDAGFMDAAPLDTGAFQDAAGTGPEYTAGPLAPSDLGELTTACTALASVDIQNDTDTARADDLAHAGFPIGRDLNLLTTDQLTMIGPGERRLQAQFDVISRWGSGPADAAAPIKWVDVSVKANVPAQTTVNYSIRRCAGLPAVGDPLAVTVTTQGTTHTINTGVATFVVSETNPAVFDSMALGSTTVYTHGPGAGPRIEDVNGNILATYIGPTDRFSINVDGPVRAVVTRIGHFTRGASYPACGVDPSYAVHFTFVRGSAQVGIDLDVINECGDGFTRPFSGLFEVDELSWRFPFTVAAGSQRRLATGFGSTVHRSAVGASGSTTIEQMTGAVNNGVGAWRQARIAEGTTTIERREYYPAPTIGVGDASFTAIAQLAKMKYREPQALHAEGDTLSIKVLASRARLGEAQGVWAFARLELLGGGLSDAALLTARDRGITDLERGLLVHSPPTYTNSAGVMPRLPTSNSTPLMVDYLGLLNQIHSAQVREGGQWDMTKNYGMFTWPDYKFDSWRRELVTPLDHTPKSNYWSATSSEVKQWWVDGDPRWVWDFAFWQEHHMYRTIAYNLGLRTGQVATDQRSGFGVGDGRVNASYPANGYRYRTGIGSDDYFYNQANLYILRPSQSLLDAHWRGGTTFINRYNVPRAMQAGRDHFLNAVRVDRGEMQHLNSLRYAAEFVPRDNQLFADKLDEVMDEFAQDNFIGGVICPDDMGNEQSCTTGQAFMYSALHLDTYREILNHWGEYRNVFRDAIVGYAKQFHDHAATHSGGNLDFGSQWSKNLACTFNNGSLVGCTGTTDGERLFDQEKPMHVSMMLMADELDPTIGLCASAAEGFPRAMQIPAWRNFFSRDAGWAKVPSQVMREVVHGIALTETCASRPAGTRGPYGGN